jgi:hypothetical protein
VGVVVASQGTYTKTIIALVAGAIFGWISEMLASTLAGAPKKAAQPAGD